MLNTHTYDGKWGEEMERVFELDGLLEEYDINEIKQEILNMNPDLEKQLNMIKDYDELNKVHSEELLARVWRKAKKEDEYDLVLEQIEDISKGPCPQGQTTRLFQILSAFY